MFGYHVGDVKKISKGIGMDLKQDQKDYTWFIKSALNSLLPKDWHKEYVNGRLYYHNSKTMVTTDQHPYLYRFRTIFKKIWDKKPNVLKNKKPIQKKTDKTKGAGKITVLTREEYQQKLDEQQRKFRQMHQGIPKKKVEYDVFQFYFSIFEEKYEEPALFKNTIAYTKVTMEEVIVRAKEMNILFDYDLYWTARVSYVMPLPPGWYKLTKTKGETYINKDWDVVIHRHPCLEFLTEVIKVKKQARGTSIDNKEMKFISKDGRTFKVNFEKYIRQSRDAIRYKNKGQKDSSDDEKEESDEAKREQEEAKKLQKLQYQLMIFDIAKSIGLNIDKDIHLIWIIHNFIDTLRSAGELDNWKFRYTAEGDKYWYNINTEKSRKTFPYMSTVSSHAFKVHTKLKERSAIAYLHINDQHPAYTSTYLYKVARDAAQSYMSKMIYRNSGSEQSDTQDLTVINEIFKTESNEKTVLDILFAWPYNLKIPNLEFMSETKLEYNLVSDEEDEAEQEDDPAFFSDQSLMAGIMEEDAKEQEEIKLARKNDKRATTLIQSISRKRRDGIRANDMSRSISDLNAKRGRLSPAINKAFAGKNKLLLSGFIKPETIQKVLAENKDSPKKSPAKVQTRRNGIFNKSPAEFKSSDISKSSNPMTPWPESSGNNSPEISKILREKETKQRRNQRSVTQVLNKQEKLALPTFNRSVSQPERTLEEKPKRTYEEKESTQTKTNRSRSDLDNSLQRRTTRDRTKTGLDHPKKLDAYEAHDILEKSQSMAPAERRINGQKVSDESLSWKDLTDAFKPRKRTPVKKNQLQSISENNSPPLSRNKRLQPIRGQYEVESPASIAISDIKQFKTNQSAGKISSGNKLSTRSSSLESFPTPLTDYKVPSLAETPEQIAQMMNVRNFDSSASESKYRSSNSTILPPVALMAAPQSKDGDARVILRGSSDLGLKPQGPNLEKLFHPESQKKPISRSQSDVRPPILRSQSEAKFFSDDAQNQAMNILRAFAENLKPRIQTHVRSASDVVLKDPALEIPFATDFSPQRTQRKQTIEPKLSLETPNILQSRQGLSIFSRNSKSGSLNQIKNSVKSERKEYKPQRNANRKMTIEGAYKQKRAKSGLSLPPFMPKKQTPEDKQHRRSSQPLIMANSNLLDGNFPMMSKNKRRNSESKQKLKPVSLEQHRPKSSRMDHKLQEQPRLASSQKLLDVPQEQHRPAISQKLLDVPQEQHRTKSSRMEHKPKEQHRPKSSQKLLDVPPQEQYRPKSSLMEHKPYNLERGRDRYPKGGALTKINYL